MPARRPNAHVHQDNVGELQDLINRVYYNKPLVDDKIIYLQRRISRLTVQLKNLRNAFLDFCIRNNINNSFVALEQVTGDFVYPDTTPGQGMEQVKVEDAMVPNVADETVLRLTMLLISKYPTLEREIIEYQDTMYKTKVHKAMLESKLIAAKQAQKDFVNNAGSKTTRV